MISRSYHSPIGQLSLSAKAGRLLSVGFEGELEEEKYTAAYPSHPDEPVLDEACWQLDEYFDGRRQRFEVPLAMMGTPFQLKVWSVLTRIPYGKAVSYLDIAKVIGKDGASQAVGAANAANPLPIFVPCHRVIASDGTLAGFRGGAEAKRSLLDLENVGAGLFACALGVS